MLSKCHHSVTYHYSGTLPSVKLQTFSHSTTMPSECQCAVTSHFSVTLPPYNSQHAMLQCIQGPSFSSIPLSHYHHTIANTQCYNALKGHHSVAFQHLVRVPAQVITTSSNVKTLVVNKLSLTATTHVVALC